MRKLEGINAIEMGKRFPSFAETMFRRLVSVGAVTVPNLKDGALT